MPTPPLPVSTPTRDLDDELDDLPPMDGGEEVEERVDYADLLEERGEDGDDPFDDATQENDPVDARDLDTAGNESGWLDDAEDADELDVGNDLALFEGDAAAGGDFEELGVGDEDFGLGGDEAQAALDGGEEGPADAEEDLEEEELPPLDADEEGDMGDGDLVEPGFGEGLDPALPWAARAWEPVGAPLGIGPTCAVACAEKGLVVAAPAAGAALVRVDLEGACESVASIGVVKRLVASGGVVVALTADGRVHASRDRGATFVVVEGSDAGAEDVALGASGEVWVRSKSGAVRRSKARGKGEGAWDAPLGAARAVAIAGDGERVVALVAESGGTLRLAGGEALPEEIVASFGAGARLVVRGDAVACAGGARGLVRRAPGGAWEAVEPVGRVTAMVFLDDRGALLAAVSSPSREGAWLVHVDAAGAARIVAELDAPTRDEDDDGDGDGDGADGVVQAMARDDAHGVVWVAGTFGLVAFEMP